MLRTPLQRLYERLGPRYSRVVLVLAFVLEFFVAGGGVLLLNLYVDISLDTFWRIALVSAVLVSLEVGAALWLGYRLVLPADRWLRSRSTRWSPGSRSASACARRSAPSSIRSSPSACSRRAP